MSTLKEITVFSIGDSKDLKAWSNVPYFFTKSIEDKSIIVNRVNIEEHPTINLLYKYSVFAFLKLFYKNTNHSYFRSGLNNYLTELKIKKSIAEYPKSDAFFFLTFSFSCKKITHKNCFLFADWSYLYYITQFLKRQPYWFEQKALKREAENIRMSNGIVSLFPKSHSFNLSRFENKNQYYFGNVINSSYVLNKPQLVGNKKNSFKLLFIGNKKYIKGATDLILAFKQLLNSNPLVELHIIGLSESDTDIVLPHLFYYGYLDKGKKSENGLYYQLLGESKAIVNTNPNWGAFSAVTEAMYYYTPVITTNYEEFVETYGNDIDFGYYVRSNSKVELVQKLKLLFDLSEVSYQEMMYAAHDRVKDFSWSNYSDKLIKLITTTA